MKTAALAGMQPIESVIALPAQVRLVLLADSLIASSLLVVTFPPGDVPHRERVDVVVLAQEVLLSS